MNLVKQVHNVPEMQSELLKLAEEKSSEEPSAIGVPVKLHSIYDVNIPFNKFHAICRASDTGQESYLEELDEQTVEQLKDVSYNELNIMLSLFKLTWRTRTPASMHLQQENYVWHLIFENEDYEAILELMNDDDEPSTSVN